MAVPSEKLVNLVDIEELAAVPSKTLVNPLPSPVKCPNEAVEVDESSCLF